MSTKQFKEIKLWEKDVTRWVEDYGANARLIDSLVRYAEKRIPCGGALTGLLENDLRGFMSNADTATLEDLDNLFKFVYNVLPGNCWGSPVKVSRWLKGTEEY
jgi:hypothetical protein